MQSVAPAPRRRHGGRFSRMEDCRSRYPPRATARGTPFRAHGGSCGTASPPPPRPAARSTAARIRHRDAPANGQAHRNHPGERGRSRTSVRPPRRGCNGADATATRETDRPPTPAAGAEALVQQYETGGFDRQRIDVDAVEAAFDEVEATCVRAASSRQVEHRLQEYPGPTGGVEDPGTFRLLIHISRGFTRDVLGDVRRGVEGPRGSLRQPGLPRIGVLHHTRPACRAVRIQDVWQQIAQVVIVWKRFERSRGFTVGELDDGVGKQGWRADVPEEPGLTIAQRCACAESPQTTADDTHGDESPCSPPGEQIEG